MQIQIAELTSRVFAVSKLSSLESNFWGGRTAFIYISVYISFLTALPPALCEEQSIISAGPRGLGTDKKEPNNPSWMGTAFLLFFQLLERVCAGQALHTPLVPANVSFHVHVCASL